MPKKILVVDDEQQILRLIRVNLERAGFEVVTAHGGKEALEKVEQERPDLVVIDVMMPYMDGFEMMQNLRKNPTTDELPVLMMLARQADVALTYVYPIQQNDDDCYLYYIRKPFNPMQLILFVQHIFSDQDRAEE